MIDIKAVKQEAAAEVAKEKAEKAKGLLKAQMRTVALAEQVVANEKRKLADLEAAIADGTY